MTFLYMVLILGLMVIVHELGHFLAAKFFKIGVPIFSLGMGQRIFGKTIKGTDYRVSLLPFGGYVKLKGMDEFDKEHFDEDDFMAKHPFKRILVIFCGPFANFLLAFVLIFIMTNVYGVLNMKNGKLESVEGFASEYFQPGDSIINVNGSDIKYFNDIYKFLRTSENNKFVVVRNNNEEIIELKIDKPDSFIIVSSLSTKIGFLSDNSPAKKAGVKENDIILSIDSSEVHSWQEVSSVIKASYEKEIALKVMRGEDTLTFLMVPEKREIEENGVKTATGIIGIGHSNEIEKPSLGKSVYYTVDRMGYISTSLVRFLGMLFTGKMSVKLLGGPIAIYSMTDQSLKWGFESVLAFIVFFSVNLFILNLLIFPPLDGSYIVIYLFEMIFKKKASAKFMSIYSQVGFVILMGLIVLVSVNDVIRLITK